LGGLVVNKMIVPQPIGAVAPPLRKLLPARSLVGRASLRARLTNTTAARVLSYAVVDTLLGGAAALALAQPAWGQVTSNSDGTVSIKGVVCRPASSEITIDNDPLAAEAISNLGLQTSSNDPYNGSITSVSTISNTKSNFLNISVGGQNETISPMSKLVVETIQVECGAFSTYVSRFAHATGFEYLTGSTPLQDGGIQSYAASGDPFVVGALDVTVNGDSTSHAFRYDLSTGINQDLGTLRGADGLSVAYGVSNDGSVVVGQSQTATVRYI